MDFKDWRKSPDQIKLDSEQAEVKRPHGKKFGDYIEEQIREAEARGAFANLPGMGKPLNLDDDSYIGEKAMAYHLLKSNGFAPVEIELAKEIRTEKERAEIKLNKIILQGRTLRSRRRPPSASERLAFNTSVENAASEYEKILRELNRKILTLNLTAPSAMHQPLLEVEKLVQEFRTSCLLYA